MRARPGHNTLKELRKGMENANMQMVSRSFMKDYERNLKSCIQILNWFYTITGLKLDNKKTKIIKTGTMNELMIEGLKAHPHTKAT